MYRTKQLANQILELYYDYSTSYVPIISIARKIGFTVSDMDLDRKYAGALICGKDAKEMFGLNTEMFIGVNKRLSNAEKRCVVTHELGKFLLSNDKNFRHYVTSKTFDKLPSGELGEFMIEILLPKYLTITAYNYRRDANGIKSPCTRAKLVSELMIVPENYVISRLVNLGAISYLR